MSQQKKKLANIVYVAFVMLANFAWNAWHTDFIML